MPLQNRLEARIEKRLYELVDGVATPALKRSKKDIGAHGEMTREQCVLLVEKIREMFNQVAGDAVGEKLYLELKKVLEE